MNTTSGAAGRAAVLVSASVVVAMLATPSAFADTTQATLGGQADVGGGQQWTVSELRPSTDVIAYSPTGTLWEATATSRSAAGGVPMVPGFTARAGAANYPVLWPVPTALGINPSALPAGGSVTGKLYFDVVGPAPAEVVFVADGADAARWVTPPPPAGSAAAPPAYSAPRAAAPAPAAAPPAPAAAQPAPVAPAPATPPPSGSSGTPLPAAGSQGTPLPAADSQGTPLPAENPTTATAPTSPSTAAAPTTAAAPPAAASQGTPLADDSAPPAAASSTPAPAAAPTTTAVPTG